MNDRGAHVADVLLGQAGRESVRQVDMRVEAVPCVHVLEADLGVRDDSRAGQPGDPGVDQAQAGLNDLLGAEPGHAAGPAPGWPALVTTSARASLPPDPVDPGHASSSSGPLSRVIRSR